MAAKDEEEAEEGATWRVETVKKEKKLNRKRRHASSSSFYSEDDGWAEIRSARKTAVLEANATRRLGASREFARQSAAFAYVDVWEGAANEDQDDDLAMARRWAAADIEQFGPDEMIDWAEERGPMRLWAVEIAEGGKRRYLAAHWSRFRSEYEKMTARHHYELIREGSPVRAYLDLEFIREENPGVDGAAMTERFLLRFATVVQEQFYKEAGLVTASSCLQLDATTAKKFSRHAIWNLPDGACFATAAVLGDVVRSVAAEPEFQVNSGTKITSFVDTAVYTRNRLFRLAASTKRNKNAPLVCLLPEDEQGDVGRFGGREAPEVVLPVASLVVPLRQPSRLLGDSGVVAAPKSSSKKNTQIVARVSLPASYKMGGGQLPSPFESVDDLLLHTVRPGCIVRKWERLPPSWGTERREGVVAYHLAKNRFCERLGREHRSNNVIVNVDLAKSEFYQTCYDPDCKGWRGEARPLPERIAADVADVLACELLADVCRENNGIE